MDWHSLKSVPSADIVEARIQLHYAAQYCASFGRYLLPPKKDDSHTSLHWHLDEQRFWTRELSAAERIRVGLSPVSFLLLIEERRGELIEITLDGKSREEVLEEFQEALRSKGVNAEQARLEMPYEMPDHVLKDGGVFSAERATTDARAALAACWSNSALLLQNQFYLEDKASPIRTWPHHFDIATLVKVEGNPDPELAKSIGVGLSPGDEGYPEPYFYITPWPYPKPLPELGELPVGHWHTDGWVGAVLKYRDLADLPVDDQASVAQRFQKEAYDLSYELLYVK